MSRDRLIQTVALVVLVIATSASGVLLPRIIEKSDTHALRYTDVSVDGAPPIVAIGTAIGAVRGLIVDYLWIKVHMMKEKGLFYEVMADAELITKLQPRFAAVWAFHGHNMAYNISVATNTEEERWRWVNAGISLVRDEGLRYNPDDLQLHRELAFWFAHKIEGVVDDAHLYYKTEFCREWHINLGEPPEEYEDRIAWIKAVADAPASLSEAIAAAPKIDHLLAEFERMAPLMEGHPLKPDRSLLKVHIRWAEARGGSAAATHAQVHDKLLATSALFTEFDRLAADPELEHAWDVLLAHVRKRVLLDEYNMDPQLMYEYTRDLGPIDWRNAQAHALYWSRRGSQRAEKRVIKEDDVYRILNNDRIQLQAMQGLARFGKMYFDHYANELPTRLPEPRWIDRIDAEFERLYIKNYKTRGGGPESFIGFFENFMSSAIREWYRAGEVARAEKLMQRLRELFTYTSEALGPNPKYLLPLDVFVKEETYDEYNFQPHLAPSEVAASLRHGVIQGLGFGRMDVLEKAIEFANGVTVYFKNNPDFDYTTKMGSGRMKDTLAELEDSVYIVFSRVMIDRSLDLPRRMAIWGRADQAMRDLRPLLRHDLRDRGSLRQWAYDRIKPHIEREMQTSVFARDRTIDEILPAPPGMEAYRAAMARQQAEQEAREAEALRRDQMERRGGVSR